MNTLTQTEITKLQKGAYSRDGILIPGTDSNDLNNAACWSWALNGGYENINSETSAPSIYQNLFVYNGTTPSNISPDFKNFITGAYPNTATVLTTLATLFPTADVNDINRAGFRLALLKLNAILYGYSPSTYNAATSPYALHMKTNSLYGWDHWGISILMPDGTRNYIQTVSGSGNNLVGIYYKCNRMWDENMPETVIGIDGLQQDHIDVINKIV